MSRPRRTRNHTPDWPTDIDAVVRALRLRNDTPETAVRTLAQALTHCGHPTVALTCILRVVAYQDDPGEYDELKLVRARSTQLYAISSQGRLWTLNRCSSWLEEIQLLAHAHLDDPKLDDDPFFRNEVLEFECEAVRELPPLPGPHDTGLVGPTIAALKAQGLQAPRKGEDQPSCTPHLQDENLPSVGMHLPSVGMHLPHATVWGRNDPQINDPGFPPPVIETLGRGENQRLAVWVVNTRHQDGPLGARSLMRWRDPAVQARLQQIQLDGKLSAAEASAPSPTTPGRPRL